MDKFKCPSCNRVFLSCDLARMLCSENVITTYIVSYCPNCLNKRPSVYAKLYEIRGKEGAQK